MAYLRKFSRFGAISINDALAVTPDQYLLMAESDQLEVMSLLTPEQQASLATKVQLLSTGQTSSWLDSVVGAVEKVVEYPKVQQTAQTWVDKLLGKKQELPKIDKEQKPTKSNTLLYIGIGLIVISGTALLLRRRK